MRATLWCIAVATLALPLSAEAMRVRRVFPYPDGAVAKSECRSVYDDGSFAPTWIHGCRWADGDVCNVAPDPPYRYTIECRSSAWLDGERISLWSPWLRAQGQEPLPVSEPSWLVLLGSGCLLLAWLARRRKAPARLILERFAYDENPSLGELPPRRRQECRSPL